MGVEFNAEKVKRKHPSYYKGGIYGFLFRRGLVRNHTEANVIMIVVLIACGIIVYTSVGDKFVADPNLAPVNYEDSWQAGDPSEVNSTGR